MENQASEQSLPGLAWEHDSGTKNPTRGEKQAALSNALTVLYGIKARGVPETSWGPLTAAGRALSSRSLERRLWPPDEPQPGIRPRLAEIFENKGGP
jgi:hypothetical protein